MSGIKELIETMRDMGKSKKEELGGIGKSDGLGNTISEKTPPIFDQLHRAKTLYGPKNDEAFMKEVLASIDHYFDAKKSGKSAFQEMTEQEERKHGLSPRSGFMRPNMGPRRADLYHEVVKIIESNRPLYMVDYDSEEQRQQMLDEGREYFKELVTSGDRNPDGKTLRKRKEKFESGSKKQKIEAEEEPLIEWEEVK